MSRYQWISCSDDAASATALDILTQWIDDRSGTSAANVSASEIDLEVVAPGCALEVVSDATADTPDGIILASPDPTDDALADAVDAARANGVSVVTIWSRLPTPTPLSHIGSDWSQIGLLLARRLRQRSCDPHSPQTIIVLPGNGAGPAIARYSFLSALNEETRVHRIEVDDAETSLATRIRMALDQLQPTASTAAVIVGFDAPSTLVAARAVAGDDAAQDGVVTNAKEECPERERLEGTVIGMASAGLEAFIRSGIVPVAYRVEDERSGILALQLLRRQQDAHAHKDEGDGDGDGDGEGEPEHRGKDRGKHRSRVHDRSRDAAGGGGALGGVVLLPLTPVTLETLDRGGTTELAGRTSPTESSPAAMLGTDQAAVVRPGGGGLGHTLEELAGAGQTTLEASYRHALLVLEKALACQKDAVLICDRSTPIHIVESNHAAKTVFGYPRDELRGMPLRDLFVDRSSYDDFLHYSSSRAVSVDEGAFHLIDLSLSRKDGLCFPAYLSIVELSDTETALGCLMVVHDLSARKNTEDALQARERLYETLVETSPDAVAVTDLELRFTYVSNRAFELHGFGSADEMLGRSVFDMLTPSCRAKAHVLKKVSRTKGSIRNAELEMMRVDGSTFIGEVSASLLYDPDGGASGYLATVRDITHRKAAEEALRRSEENYRRIVENINDALVIHDIEGNLLDVNDNCCQMLGYEREELLEKEWTELTPKDLWRKMGEWTQILLDRGNFVFDAVVLHRTGRRIPVSVSARASAVDGGVVIQSFMRDITLRKRAEQELREKTELLETMINSATYAIFVADADREIVLMNTACGDLCDAIMTNWTFPEILENVHREDRREANHAFRAALEGRSSQDEYRVMFEDGLYHILTISFSPMTWSGEPHVLEVLNDVTELKRAEEEIHVLSQFRQRIIENANVWLDVLDDRGNILIWNHAAEEISGYARHEVIGHRRAWEWLYPDEDYRREIKEHANAIIEEGVVVENYETRILTKGGEERIISWNSHDLTDHDGTTIGSISIGRDVTEQKRMREALRATLESTADGILVVDKSGTITHSNARFCSLWRMPKQLGEGASYEEFLDCAQAQLVDPASFIEKFEHLYRSDQIDFDVLYFNDDRGFECYSSPLVRDGELIGRVWSFRDITERLHAEERLRETKQFLDSVINSMHDPVFVKNEAHEWVLMNDSMCEMMGLAREELLGRSDYDIFPRSEADVFWEKDDLVLRTGEPNVNEERFTAPDGVHVILTAKSRYRDSLTDERFIVGSIRDITERKKVEERLRTTLAELKRSNADLEQFAYLVSHDLRAPLRSINGFSRALLEDYTDALDEVQTDYLQRIHRGSVRMGQLIDDLLKLSRVTRGALRRVKVDLSATAFEIVDRLKRREPGRASTLEIEIEEGMSAWADERLINVVLENLIGNAWKFTSRCDHATIRVGSSQENGRTVFSVADTGTGFDMAYVDKLFVAFQRLHRESEFPGTGIGLVTVRRVIERHGGRVWAEGEVGVGATFYFTLPHDN